MSVEQPSKPMAALSGPTPCVVLLSGGLDSATALGVAREAGHRCHCLTVDYGQRHIFEVDAARAVARDMSRKLENGGQVVEHRVVRLDLRAIGGSALTDDIDVPAHGSAGAAAGGDGARAIPATYVPARNLAFLAIAAGYAETVGARDIYIGVNAVDYSGYPDCREEFVRAFELAANLGTRVGVERMARGEAYLRVRTPLLNLSKAEIIALGVRSRVRFELTHSCYDPDGDGRACGRCDSCVIRRRGFEAAGVSDPTRYAAGVAL